MCVIVAHPDDEVLGCGGTIARYVQEGWNVHVLILVEGLMARFNLTDREGKSEDLHHLAHQATKAHECLGTTTLELKSFPDNRLDSVDLLDVVKEIENFLEKYNPEFVFTHHAGDVNIDHRIVHQAVTAACRPVGGRKEIKGLFLFEVASSSEWQLPGMYPSFAPNFFIDIHNYLPRKIESLHCYGSEMRPFPHSRSYEAIEALARWRGACAGFAAAEAFCVGRMRW